MHDLTGADVAGLDMNMIFRKTKVFSEHILFILWCVALRRAAHSANRILQLRICSGSKFRRFEEPRLSRRKCNLRACLLEMSSSSNDTFVTGETNDSVYWHWRQRCHTFELPYSWVGLGVVLLPKTPLPAHAHTIAFRLSDWHSVPLYDVIRQLLLVGFIDVTTSVSEKKNRISQWNSYLPLPLISSPLFHLIPLPPSLFPCLPSLSLCLFPTSLPLLTFIPLLGLSQDFFTLFNNAN